MHDPAAFAMHLPDLISSLPALPALLPRSVSMPSLAAIQSSLSFWPSLSTLAASLAHLRHHPRMLHMATLFADEQRLLNRVWVVLLGLQALLVLFGTVSAVVRSVVAVRKGSLSPARRGGLRRAGTVPWPYPQRVTMDLPATVHESYANHQGYNYDYDYGYGYDDGYAEAYDGYAEPYAMHAHGHTGTPAYAPNSPSSKV